MYLSKLQIAFVQKASMCNEQHQSGSLSLLLKRAVRGIRISFRYHSLQRGWRWHEEKWKVWVGILRKYVFSSKLQSLASWIKYVWMKHCQAGCYLTSNKFACKSKFSPFQQKVEALKAAQKWQIYSFCLAI